MMMMSADDWRHTQICSRNCQAYGPAQLQLQGRHLLVEKVWPQAAAVLLESRCLLLRDLLRLVSLEP